MPKNKGKGGKNRRRGKNENEPVKRELIYATHDQAYAKVSSKSEFIKYWGSDQLFSADFLSRTLNFYTCWSENAVDSLKLEEQFCPFILDNLYLVTAALRRFETGL